MSCEPRTPAAPSECSLPLAADFERGSSGARNRDSSGGPAADNDGCSGGSCGGGSGNLLPLILNPHPSNIFIIYHKR